MTIKRGVPVGGQLVPNATGVLFTPAVGINRSVITSVSMFANVAVSDVQLFIIPDGGSSSDSNQVTQKSFSINEEYSAPELIGQTIEFGGSISGNDGGNGGTGVNIVITVTEFSGDS